MMTSWAKKKKCSFLALVGMLAQTLKNAIKKLGLRLGFLKIFFQNPEVVSLVGQNLNKCSNLMLCRENW